MVAEVEMILGAIIAFSLPILIIRAIAAIPGWFWVVWGGISLVILCVVSLHEINGWSLWLDVPLGVFCGFVLFVAAVVLTDREERADEH